MTAPKITPCLWFDFNAEAAVDHYRRIFRRSAIHEISRYGESHPALAGQVLVIRFELEGQPLMALNGGPQFPFTEAVSMMIDCADQAEIDRYWDALTAGGGEPGVCGWCKDRFGLSWQIIPKAHMQMMSDSDGARVARVVQAMMQMSKFDIAALQRAYDGA